MLLSLSFAATVTEWLDEWDVRWSCAKIVHESLKTEKWTALPNWSCSKIVYELLKDWEMNSTA